MPPLSPQLRLLWLLRTLLVASALVPLAFFAVSAWLSYRAVFQSAESRAQHLTRLLQEHTLKSFETIRLVLQHTDQRLRSVPWETIRNSQELWTDVELLQGSVEQVASIFVIAPDGSGALSTRAFPHPPMNFADRDYFEEQQKADRGVFVGRPYTGRISREPIFNFSIRRNSPDGSFNGVIGISALNTYFEDFYATVGSASDNFAVSVIRDDGQFLVRYPRVPDASITAQTIVRQLGGRVQATSVAASPVDGLERLFHIIRVPNFPVYVAYGIDRRTILAEWYRDLWLFGAIAAATGAALMLTTWLALQRARHEARAAQALQQTSRDLADEISRRERAEASLLQAQRLEAVGQLTGGIAHDFNNLLTIILGNLQLAERRNELGRIRQLHGAIRQAAERGAALTRQLLAFSRQQLLRPETVRLNDVLENARTWIGGAITEAVEVSFDLAPDLGPVQVDVSELEAAILNIAVNARDAMPAGGRLTMRTRNLTLTAADVAERRLAVAPGAYVCLSIHDTGTGMSPDVLARVYEPFFTTKEVDKGTGLGLSRVYGFVQQSGGAIWIESEVDQGTNIHICLPRATGAVTSLAQERPSAAKAKGEGTILVVEDSDPLRKISVSLLHDAGYSTVTARNGTEALAMLKAGEPIDLLFSDIVMPRGMSGLQLAQEAVTLRPGLKVLLTTGFPHADATKEFAVLAKPFTEAELTRAVKAAIGVEATHERNTGAQPLTAPP